MSDFAIETRGLTRRFGSHAAVDGLDLRIRKGSVYGFLGPNGCGKTTTMRMLSGLLEPSGGSIMYGGREIRAFSTDLRRRIGYMSQRFSLYNELSTHENLTFYAGMYGLSGRERRERVNEVTELTQLHGYDDALVGTLSGGWRQRVALCAAIMHRPELLFLDEPTSGVDPISSRLFWDVVYALAAEGVSIVVSTHSMNEAEHCDEVGFLNTGRLIRSGTPSQLRASLPGRMVSIASEDAVALSHALKARFSFSYLYGSEVRVHVDEGQAPELDAYEWHDVEPTLEDLFVYLTEGPDVDAS